MTLLRLLLVPALLAAASAAQAGTLDDIKANAVIDIGIRQDARPFSYLDGDGKPAGYSIDLCNLITEGIGRELGLEGLERRYHIVSAEDRLEKLQNGDVDIVCGATTNTLARQEKVAFSLLTFITGADMMTRREATYSGLNDLSGMAVGVRAGTTTERGLNTGLKRLGVEADVVPFDTHDEGMGALVTGEIEAYFGDRIILIGMLRDSPSAPGLRLAGQFFSYEPYALPVRRGDEDFKLAVDRQIAALYRSGEIGQVFSRAFPGAEPSDLLKALFLLQGLPRE